MYYLFSFLSIVSIHPHFYASFFFSPSIFFLFHDYQVLLLLLCGGTLRSFGREPVSRTEQRTECKFFFLSFFFSRHLFSDQQQLFFASSAIYKREMRVSLLLFFFFVFLVLLNDPRNFFSSTRTQITGANTYATRFRSLEVYFSYSSHFFGIH